MNFEDIIEIKFDGLSNEILNRESFYGMKYLRKLDLKEKSLTSLHQDIFIDLINLEELDLSNNHFTKIKDYYFRGLINLKMLNLSKCSIRAIDDRAFHECRELQNLILSHNLIENIGENLFYLPSENVLGCLKSIDLSHNNLTKVDYDSLAFLLKLNYLDLSFNQIDFID